METFVLEVTGTMHFTKYHFKTLELAEKAEFGFDKKTKKAVKVFFKIITK